jgi:hypothetical protein
LVNTSSIPISKIFTDAMIFISTSSSLQNVNYNSISIPTTTYFKSAEIQSIPSSFRKVVLLLDFVENGGHLLVIPDQKI